MDINKKILIVDDFATMRRILRNILKEIGFTNISEADNGKTALNALKKENYDLVLCDWNMPEMSGLELLNKIRSDDELKGLLFVMVTAEASKKNIIEAIKAGVNSYIVKPFTAETVNKILNKMLGG